VSFFRYASGQRDRYTDMLVAVFASLLGVKLVGWSLMSLFSTSTAISETLVSDIAVLVLKRDKRCEVIIIHPFNSLFSRTAWVSRHQKA